MFCRPKQTLINSVVLSILALGLTGCGKSGPKLAEVEGTVTLDGKPLADVMLEFQPLGGKGSPSVGYTDKNGRFRLRFSRQKWGALPGEHLVRIDFDHEPGSDQPAPPFKFPAKFNKQSDLKRQLVVGSNHFPFELASADMVVKGTKKRAR